MELQDITADMGEAPVAENTQVQSVSQADDVTSNVTTVDDVVEEKSETKADDGTETKEEATVDKPEAKSESKVEGEDNLPFFERPGVKERIEGIKTQYESKANYWDTIAEISQNDPEFRLLVIQRLENAGRVPKGTTAQLRGQVEASQQAAQEKSQYLDNLPPEVREDLQAVKVWREQQEAEAQARTQEVETFFMNFESNKPDIEKSPNPERTRNLIFNMASEMVDRGVAKFEDAMERAYKIVLHPESIASEAKEKGQVEALVQSNQEASSAITSGGASAGKPVKLTPDERRAMELIGITDPNVYRKMKDSGEEIFETI